MVRPVTEQDTGLKVLREPNVSPEEEKDIIDIVAIHGIGAHPDDTWCKNVGTAETSEYVNWLVKEDMLPAIAPKTRIMRYGYQSKWFGENAIRHNISTVAPRMLRALRRKRKEIPFRPLIFIAHCFGGLVVLKALLEAKYYQDEWPGLWTSTTGIMFFGTPFRGAGGMSQVEMIEAALREYHPDEVQPESLKVLEPGNETLQEMVDKFGTIWTSQAKAEVACFFELMPTNVGRIVGREDRTRFVVDQSSGCLDQSDSTKKFSLERTHFNMNKFSSPTEEDFETVAETLEVILNAAHGLILARQQSPRSKPHLVIPFQRNAKFVGRDAELTEIEQSLSSDIRCERAAIIGLGGVGKTQVGLEFAYRMHEQGTSVFWIPMGSIDAMNQAYLEVGKRLQIRGLDHRKEDAERLVLQYLDLQSSEKWLLVFDNSDEIDLWTMRVGEECSNYRMDLLPKNTNGSILFTTRDRKAAVKLASQNVTLIQEMDRSIAEDLLRRSLIQKDTLSDDHVTARFLEMLTHLPLAIVQAVAYINENAIGLYDYMALLEGTEQNVIDMLSEDFEDESRYGDAKNPVATTWVISFVQIRQRNPLAAELLSFMACIESKDIPLSILPQSSSSKESIEAIGTLNAYSFITRHKTNDMLDLHRLVHLATRNWLHMEAQLKNQELIVLRHLEEVFPSDDYKNRTLWRSYLSHAKRILDSPLHDASNSEKQKLLRQFGDCVYEDGRYHDAVYAYQQVLDARKKDLGEKHPRTLTVMHNLARSFAQQGYFKEAEELHSAELELSKVVLGDEHTDTLCSTDSLAMCYWGQDRLKEAEDLELSTLKTRKKVLGNKHKDTLSSIGNLARIYADQGRLEKAEDLELSTLEIIRTVLGADHPNTLTNMQNLASTWRSQGKNAKAIAMMKECVQRRQSALGPDHPQTIDSEEYLAEWQDEETRNMRVSALRHRSGKRYRSLRNTMLRLSSRIYRK